jgi:adenosylcobinamide-GDP ribazoletransferase
VNPIGTLRAALAFLTRIPVGKAPLSERDIAWAPALFPLVGALLGGVFFLLFTALSGFDAWVGAIVITAFGVYVTGAFHEDGLADTADALGSNVSKERALEILKDSRIGSYGTCALVLSLLLRVALFANLGTNSLIPILVYGAIARLSPLWLMTHLSHANPSQGKLKDLQQIGKSRAYVGTAIAVALSVAVTFYEPGSEYRLGVAFAVTALTCLWFGRLAQQRLGGITGDLLGASEQIAELMVLLTFAWQLP